MRQDNRDYLKWLYIYKIKALKGKIANILYSEKLCFGVKKMLLKKIEKIG